MDQWLQTPPGALLNDWTLGRLDQFVVDAFGFHAVQLGLPGLDGLRANRMPHRWLFDDEWPGAHVCGSRTGERAVALVCDFDALPLPSDSIDLVLLPHTLELSHDPHQALREVARVLRPEGRVVVVGFNPASLWGLRQRCGRLRRGLGFGRASTLFMPRAGDFIGYWRLRDWLRLLALEPERGQFGVYRPPFLSRQWLERFDWIEALGERWWPVLGAVYVLVAVKRVRGMRLIGLPRRAKAGSGAGAMVAARRHAQRHHAVEVQEDA